MGFISFIKDQNNEAHSERLFHDIKTSLCSLGEFDEQIRNAIIIGFLQIRNRIISQSDGISSKELIEIAKHMQQQAREKMKEYRNVPLSMDSFQMYSKWLGGAWLESRERRSSKKSLIAFELLESFASEE